jgi:hypothetical protein
MAKKSFSKSFTFGGLIAESDPFLEEAFVDNGLFSVIESLDDDSCARRGRLLLRKFLAHLVGGLAVIARQTRVGERRSRADLSTVQAGSRRACLHHSYCHHSVPHSPRLSGRAYALYASAKSNSSSSWMPSTGLSAVALSPDEAGTTPRLAYMREM